MNGVEADDDTFDDDAFDDDAFDDDAKRVHGQDLPAESELAAVSSVVGSRC